MKGCVNMSIEEAKGKIFDVFEQNNVTPSTQKHMYSETLHTCKNGTKIIAYLPGFKTKFIGGNVSKYDYRVDMHKNGVQYALSHSNIILDLYCKCCEGFPTDVLKKILIDLFKNGVIDESNYPQIFEYKQSSIPTDLLEDFSKYHTNLNKKFELKAHEQSMNFEELLNSIMWIAIQEDINYPIPRFEGRKMPLSRYIEAIWCYEDKKHELSEVIERALTTYKRPSKWEGYNYGFLDSIK